MQTRVLDYIALIIAGSALFLALLSFLTSVEQDNEQLGVCVTYDVNTVGTTVESPVINGNIISCTTGIYTPVKPVAGK